MNREACENPVLPVACRACGGQHLQHRADISLYLPDGSMPDSIWRCRSCGSYTRLADYDDLNVRRHFENTSYTPLENESATRATRGPFLDFISRLSASYLGQPLMGKRILDVGATYGILADLYTDQGAVCSVVEIVAFLRDELNRRGYQSYTSPEEIPPGATFDIITMIDSLYYVQEPATMLQRLHTHLSHNGILVVRIANRTRFLQALEFLGRPVTSDQFGDAKHNFSLEGMRILLENCGFQIAKTVFRERGKRPPTWKTWLYYHLGGLISRLPGVVLTPGIILICKRK